MAVLLELHPCVCALVEVMRVREAVCGRGR